MDQIKTGKYIISLIRAVLTDSVPEEKPEDISFDDIYAMAKKHHIRNLCLAAVEKLEQKPEKQLLQEWQKQRMISMTQSAVQLSERDIIIRRFSESGVKCLPLKGCLMKEMYPKAEYREMSDLDLLITHDDSEKAGLILEELGYEKDRSELIDDSYMKAPFMHVELHFSLLNELFIEKYQTDKNMKSVASDPWNYAIKTDLSNIYCFSWEDFYVYMILHLIKHYISSGIGIRQFVDIWMFNQNHKVNKDYVYQELSKYGFRDFLLNAEELVDTWFSGETLSSDLIDMESYIFNSGVFGNLDNRVNHQIDSYFEENSNNTEFSYILNRMFPPLKKMRVLYPVLKSKPILLPAFWIYRLFARITSRRHMAESEIKAIKDYRKKNRKNSEK